MPVAAARRPVVDSIYSISKGVGRTDVKEQNGLEVPRQLQWAKWHVGGEFFKVLCVKNVSTDVIKFTYRLLPAGNAFIVDYPEPRRLSPGMSATIRVVFRPSIRQAYAEELELQSGTSSIIVPLSAVLPASKLQLPSTVDFGCVPVRQSCVQQLPLKNVGDAGLQFSWKVQEPFAIVPATGQLAPGQTLLCEAHFHPQEAAAYRVAAACSLDNGELLTVQACGMAKFPFLSLESDTVDMGDVVVGQTTEAFVRFGNHSPVPANFFLAAGPGSHDGTITVQPSRGSLQPNEYSVLRIVFCPRATGAFSCETFTLVTEGGNKLALICKGTAVAPRLRLSARVFAFGSVKSGHIPSKVLYLENDSDVALQYQFLAGSGGIFTLTRAQGHIRPHSMAHTGVKFVGTTPGNYWQRLVCLVKDGDPQAIDVFASCYDDTSRPPLLSYKHIQAHLSRPFTSQGQLAVGNTLVGSLSGQMHPHAEDTVQSSSGDGAGATLLGSNTGSYGTSTPSDPGVGCQGSLLPLVPAQQQQQGQVAGPDSWQALFDGLEASQPAVTVSETVLDFGCCSRLSPAEPQSFQVTNNTNAKVVVSVSIPNWSDPMAGPATTGPLQHVFAAFPESIELRPQATGTIRLAFRPPRDGQYYCQDVILMSSVKAMRSFRLVQEHQVVPPWTCALLACGNTFANVNPELSPKVSLSASTISLPACLLGQAVHQTLCLTNHGDTPVHFAFNARAASAGHAGASRLNAAAAVPAAQIAARGGASAAGNCNVSGSSTSSSQKAGLVAAGGAWFGQFAVLPVQGVLEPNSQQLVALRFKPCSLVPTELKLSCIFNHSTANSSTVLLSGTASEPRLVWDVPDNCLFFRPTCTGACSQRQVMVRNASKVPVGWQWVLSKKLQGAVTVAPMCGMLRGYESVKVTVAFSPVRQGLYDARAALLVLPAADAALGPSGTTLCSGPGASLLHITPAALEYSQAATADLDGVQEPLAQQGASAPGVATADTGHLACEKLILSIVGEATQGALCIEPASIAFGNISVGYPQRTTLKLINQSAGVLRYTVAVEDDNPAGVDRSEVACDFGSGAAVLPGSADCWLDAPEGLVNARASKTLLLTLLPRRRSQYRLRLSLHAATVPQLPPSSVSHRSLSAGSPASSPGSEPSNGRLAASASGAHSPLKLGPGSPANSPSPRGGKLLGQTRLVKSAGVCLQQSSLGAARDESDVRGKLGGQVAAESAASGSGEALDAIRAARSARGCAGDSAASREDDMVAVDDGGSGAECCALPEKQLPAASCDRPPLATAAITADASFPSLLLTDVFSEGLPKQVSWQILGLSQINAELRCSVTAAEVQAQQLADKGQLSDENAASVLPPFLLNMGVTAAGTRARQFWVEFTNDGVLPVDWELHSYDAPQVDLENWVEAARPLTQAEKERAFIIDNKVFEVLPRHGCVLAGQSQQVCLRFNPVVEGTYCLPLFWRIKDGKQLQLQLAAQAVAPSAQVALAARGSHSCQLTAAPIGELAPPLQQYTLRNGGPAPLQYSLDTAPLHELAKQNYSAEVIKYAGGSPLSGEIAPGGVAVFNWLFQPLEAKAYSVALPLSVGGLPPQPLLVHGRGYHPVQQQEQAKPTAEEAEQHWRNWLGFSQHPAASAHNQHDSSGSGRWLLSSPEVLDLGVCLPASSAKQLLTLTNTSVVPLEFAWQLGVFEEQRGIMSGRLAIVPTSGVLEPGEARVCQVRFQAGLQPQLFSGEIYCHAAEVRSASASCGPTLAAAAGVGLAAQGLTLEQWQAVQAAGQGEAGDEEIIAQDPPTQTLPPAGKVLRERLPLHLSMTQSACNRFAALKQRYQQALTLRTAATSQPQSNQQQQQHLDQVAPQLLTLTVQGAVLCKAHINMGSYICPQELPRARKLLAVAHLLPSVQQPVSLMPAPGAMGPSAAAAKAARAAAVQQAEQRQQGASDDSAVVADATLLAEAAAESAGTDQQQQALSMAGLVLEQMLAEAWADADIVNPSVVRSTQAPNAAQPSQSTLQQMQQAGNIAQGASLTAAAGQHQLAGMDDVVGLQDFHAFAEYVLDNALLGALVEGVAGVRE